MVEPALRAGFADGTNHPSQGQLICPDRLKRQLQTGPIILSSPSNMPSTRKTFVALLLLTLSLLGFSGCVDPKQDSSIPWNRPANWEGRIPGMGQ